MTTELAQAVELHRAGRLEEAARLYQSILAREPNNANALAMLGTVRSQQGQHEQAIALLERAIAIDPRHAAARNNLAGVLSLLGRHREEASQRAALAQMQPSADAYVAWGTAIGKVDVKEAAEIFRKVLALDASHAAANANLALILANQGYVTLARKHYETAIRLAPGVPLIRANDGLALLAAGELDGAIARYREAIALEPGNAAANSHLLLALHYHPNLSAADVFQEHRQWAKRFADPLTPAINKRINTAADEQRPLRVGYLSPDFREHAVAFFIEPVLAHHDRDAVIPFAYNDGASNDAYTQRIAAAAGNWRETAPLDDAQLVEQIRADGIDVLVDLAGHTGRRMLALARRAAPVQVSWIGYPGSTGLASMDHWITDAHCDPEGQSEAVATEKLVRLPQTFACYQPPADAPDVTPLPALKNGFVTFGSFNIPAKLNDRVIATWATALRALPNSRLILGSATSLRDPQVQDGIAKRFASVGIARERLTFLGSLPLKEYLAAHNEIDILLDSFPFTGHTVSLHGMWMGCPVVTLAGDRHVARRGVSVLRNVGLESLIAASAEDFAGKIMGLAADLEALAAIRFSLRDRMRASPLMQYPRFTEDLERLYRHMLAAR